MKQLNLDGEWENSEDIQTKAVQGHFKSWRAKEHYRKGNLENCCKRCIHFDCIGHHNKTYLKCKLQGISMSEASDIRASYVCDLFHRPAEKEG